MPTRFATCALAILAASAWAEELSFTCATDKPAIAYQPGEKMVFSVQLLADGKAVAGRKLVWSRRGDDKKTDKGEAVSADGQPLTITTATDQPGFVHVVVSVVGDDGKPYRNAKNQEVKGEFGAAVQPGKLAGVPEPADFDAFWERQKAKLKTVPVTAEQVKVEGKKDGFEVFTVAIACPGGKPVSGYLTRPVGAAPKSLVAQINFMGYGVNSANPDCRAGAIMLSINAHGIENGKDAAFYEALKNGALRGYAFDKTENADPEKAYFNGMALRVMRGLEFLKQQPEWNGKDLAANGGSQGGLQAIWAAGLDPQVTFCGAWKPWCCDLGGVTLGRVGGWRPEWAAGLGYYDTINHAKRIRCPVTITSGLGDYVCPPSGISVLYNSIPGKREITYVQGSTHGYDPPGAAKFKLPGQ